VNFADAGITNYIRDNFEVLQLNLIGSRKVTDFDRQELTEKDLAQKYGIRFTPTFQFFPPSAGGIEAKEPMAREVARAPGYLKPQHFLAMFRFVRERAYERGSFREYLAANG
jgi:thioredoxin-related protein